ncbi:MAG: hypothetical protein IPJ50_16995 [Betaproteobacteria bacterium]|nr:hypothetical protein [Betaproteobacteria bacterium]
MSKRKYQAAIPKPRQLINLSSPHSQGSWGQPLFLWSSTSAHQYRAVGNQASAPVGLFVGHLTGNYQQQAFSPGNAFSSQPLQSFSAVALPTAPANSPHVQSNWLNRTLLPYRFFLWKLGGMDMTREQREKKPPGKSLFGRVKLILLVSSFLGLGSLNIATLINDQLHTASYSVLQRVLGAALADARLEKILSHSPSVERKRDVAVATEALRTEKTQLTSRNHELTSDNHKLTNKHAELEKSHKDISTKHADLKATNIKQAAVAGVSPRKSQRDRRRPQPEISRHLAVRQFRFWVPP